jgi:hypothetical protein
MVFSSLAREDDEHAILNALFGRHAQCRLEGGRPGRDGRFPFSWCRMSPPVDLSSALAVTPEVRQCLEDERTMSDIKLVREIASKMRDAYDRSCL